MLLDQAAAAVVLVMAAMEDVDRKQITVLKSIGLKHQQAHGSLELILLVVLREAVVAVIIDGGRITATLGVLAAV